MFYKGWFAVINIGVVEPKQDNSMTKIPLAITNLATLPCYLSLIPILHIPIFNLRHTNLCLRKRGFPLHLMVTHFPTGMSFRLTSILANANTSFEADMLKLKIDRRSFPRRCTYSVSFTPFTNFKI